MPKKFISNHICRPRIPNCHPAKDPQVTNLSFPRYRLGSGAYMHQLIMNSAVPSGCARAESGRILI